MLSTPSCTSLRSSSRASSSGPISEMVARTGWPCSPNRSQNIDRELVGLVVEAQVLGALDEGVLRLADRRDAGQIALDVGGEHRNARAREAFGQHLQRHGLAGAGRAGHKAVAIAEVQRQIFRLAALADENLAVLIEIRHRVLPCGSRAHDVRAAKHLSRYKACLTRAFHQPYRSRNDLWSLRSRSRMNAARRARDDLDARRFSCLCFRESMFKIIQPAAVRGMRGIMSQSGQRRVRSEVVARVLSSRSLHLTVSIARRAPAVAVAARPGANARRFACPIHSRPSRASGPR